MSKITIAKISLITAVFVLILYLLAYPNLAGAICLLIFIGLVPIFLFAPTDKEIEKERLSLTLPIKTKIAAWWMTIIGGILAIFGLLLGLFWQETLVVLVFIALFGFFVLFMPGITLLKGNKWAFFVSIIYLAGLSLFVIFFWILRSINAESRGGFSFLSLVIILITGFPFFFPLILLILDRKNFFKIAS